MTVYGSMGKQEQEQVREQVREQEQEHEPTSANCSCKLLLQTAPANCPCKLPLQTASITLAHARGKLARVFFTSAGSRVSRAAAGSGIWTTSLVAHLGS
jgi:hypothetical protein